MKPAPDLTSVADVHVAIPGQAQTAARHQPGRASRPLPRDPRPGLPRRAAQQVSRVAHFVYKLLTEVP